MEASGADVIPGACGRIENDLRGHQRDLLSLHGLAALKKLPTQPGQKILIGLHRCYGVRNFETHWPGALRRRLLTTEKAIQIANLAESILAENEVTVSTSAVLQLVSRWRCSAYDCEFVALAKEQRVPLVTLDRQLLHDFPRIAVSLQEFIRE